MISGWLFEYILSTASKAWDGIVQHPLLSSVSACVLAAVVGIAIEESSKASGFVGGSGVPLFPSSWCRIGISGEDECSLLGITIPCHKTFSEDSLEHFGFGLEQSHLWTFFITFTIGLIALWCTGLTFTPSNFKEKSLKLTCALYAIDTALFALVRFYWGVSKPLVRKLSLHSLF